VHDEVGYVAQDRAPRLHGRVRWWEQGHVVRGVGAGLNSRAMHATAAHGARCPSEARPPLRARPRSHLAAAR